MARHSVAGLAAGIGSATLPMVSLYSIAGTRPVIREVGLWNTVATAVELNLTMLTTLGTAGAGLTEAEHDPDGSPPLCTAFDVHTGAPTLGNVVKTCILGAAIGSGVIWTFGADGLRPPTGTGNGIGIILAAGTGQIIRYDITWDE